MGIVFAISLSCSCTSDLISAIGSTPGARLPLETWDRDIWERDLREAGFWELTRDPASEGGTSSKRSISSFSGSTPCMPSRYNNTVDDDIIELSSMLECGMTAPFSFDAGVADLSM